MFAHWQSAGGALELRGRLFRAARLNGIRVKRGLSSRSTKGLLVEGDVSVSQQLLRDAGPFSVGSPGGRWRTQSAESISFPRPAASPRVRHMDY